MARWVASLVVFAFALALPAAAGAARVRLQYGECKYECDVEVVYSAAPGERNDVSLSSQARTDQAYDVVVTDAGAPLAAGAGCRPIDAHTAACEIYDQVYLEGERIRLGDLNDRLDLSRMGSGGFAYGGGGQDVLVGNSDNDVLIGGPGRDLLVGGRGRDTAVYPDTTAGLRVDLQSRAPQGPPGARDVLRSIENVEALHAPGAVLLGNGQPNGLYAGDRGRVVGRGGNDHLFAGRGGRVFGGIGNDTLEAVAYGAHSLAKSRPPRVFGCGPGRDRVEEPRLGDVVRESCEKIAPDGGSLNEFVALTQRPRRGRPFAVLKYGCEIEENCPLGIVARIGSVHGDVVAATRVWIRYEPSGTTYHPYGLELSPAGRAILRRRGRLRVVVYWHEGPYRTAPAFTPREGFSTILRG